MDNLLCKAIIQHDVAFRFLDSEMFVRWQEKLILAARQGKEITRLSDFRARTSVMPKMVVKIEEKTEGPNIEA